MFVGRQRIITAREHDVIPAHAHMLVAFAACHNNAPLRAPELRQQMIGQQKRRQVIERKLLLVPFFGRGVPTPNASGVVDQHIKLIVVVTL